MAVCVIHRIKTGKILPVGHMFLMKLGMYRVPET